MHQFFTNKYIYKIDYIFLIFKKQIVTFNLLNILYSKLNNHLIFDVLFEFILNLNINK
jgi:hypothetical protein